MSSLRAKLAALIVAAILSVIGLATLVSTFLLEPPGWRTANDATALQIALVAHLAERAEARPGELGGPRALVGIADGPAPGIVQQRPTRALGRALRRHIGPRAVAVTRPGGVPWPVASVELGERRWLLLPMAIVPPPPNRSWVVAGWMLLVALGTTGVVVVAVLRLTRPLALLDRFAAGIGPDGELPTLPETGPAEVRSTARAINLLSARLRSAMESRMRLVAAAGHDLRTPMTRLRLRAEFLPEEERDAWLADLDELDRIADSAIRLVREEVEGTPQEPVRLDELAREVADELVSMRLPAEVAASEPVTVKGLPLSLKRAVRNLMINAATHGRGARVTVRAEGGSAVLLIEDGGPGIPESLLARVFEPFFRVDPARKAATPGAGLGLAIASEIVRRSGGELTLENRAGGGLSQRMALPLA